MSLELNKTLAGLPRTERGLPVVLHAHPKGTNYLYANGNNIFIRDFEDPSICDIYSQHAKETTVAAYAPSGFYIASGDKAGKVRIWDTINKEHILKAEYPIVAGAIKDIAWTEDSKRILAVGEGSSCRGRFFLFDSGSSVGEVEGNIKKINSCDIKQTRPYRAITGSEDFTFSFYEGPPFKLKKKTQGEFTNFVNCIRYAPDGSKFVVGDASGKCLVCDGKTGEILCELNNDKIHKGGIYGLSWSNDSKLVLSTSADKTAKIWNIEENILVTEFKLGRSVENQQVGCLWSGDNLLSLSLSGNITYLNKDNPEEPLRVLHGHNKAVTCVEASTDSAKIISASFDGRTLQWDVDTGLASPIGGRGHQSQVTKMSVYGNTILTCGIDDTVHAIDVEKGEFTSSVCSTPSQPQGIAAGANGLAVVACIKEVVVIRDFNQVSALSVNYEPRCVAINPDQNEVAVGSGMLREVKIYDLEGDSLKEKATLTTMGDVSDVKYSPCGAFLAFGDSGRSVTVYKTSNYKESIDRCCSHSARVNVVAWSPDSKHIASCSIDKSLLVCSVDGALTPVCHQKLAHGSNVTGVAWLGNNRIVTSGHSDCSLRTWDFKP